MMVATGEVPDTYKKMLAQRDPGTQPQVGSYHQYGRYIKAGILDITIDIQILQIQ